MLVRYHHTQRYKAAGWTSWWWRDVHWRCERPFRTTTRIIHFITFSWIKKKRQWWTSPISSLQDVKIIIVLFFAGEWLGLHYIVWSEECSLLLNNINFSFGNDFHYLLYIIGFIQSLWYSMEGVAFVLYHCPWLPGQVPKYTPHKQPHTVPKVMTHQYIGHDAVWVRK